MNRIYCLINLFFICITCKAQNFVPNGSFEWYTSCPTGVNQVDSVLFWKNPTNESPDYFNSCGTGLVSVPNNFTGYQPAHMGNAYCGLTLIKPASIALNFREYIEVSLLAPLTQGQLYHFEMYVSISENHQFSSDAFGVYFSNTLMSGVSWPLFSILPQIINTPGFYPDTANWSMVSGNYTAHGGEQYLVIGNFKNDANTSYIQTSNSPYTYAYLLVDDVSLTQVTGINDFNSKHNINVYPNPFTNKLVVETTNDDISEIVLYDISSRIIMKNKFTQSVSLSTKQLSKGIYIYEVRNKNGEMKKGKVVKE